MEEEIRIRMLEAVAGALEAVNRELKDKKQFHRYLTKAKGEEEYREQICKKADTKAMKELTSILRELCAMRLELAGGTSQGEDSTLRVVFEAGEESWNA